MAKRQKQWAARATLALRIALGSHCAHCGISSQASPLEFDCIRPQGHRHHALDYSARLSFYRAQHQALNLQLLCPRCHSLKSAQELPRRSLLSLRCPACSFTWHDPGSLAGNLCPRCYPS